MCIRDRIKGILQICHGMVEYIKRYRELGEYLSGRGYYVTGHDHLGHGQSVQSEADYGYFNEKKGNLYVDVYKRQDDGRNLFQGENITRQGIEAFSIVVILAVSAIVWEMVRKRRSVLTGMLLVLFLAPGLILGYLSAVSAAILLTAGFGAWLNRVQGSRQLQRLSLIHIFIRRRKSLNTCCL